MTRGLKSGTAIIALLAGMGIGFGAAPAKAADLGGDCCADLEERIAELEATTARKGNRKVKLEISGHVNEALIFWDDGVESNAGVYTNDNSRSRFRFKGTGTITDDLKAGYLIEIGVRSANSKRFTQEDPNPAAEAGLDVRHSAWFVESKSLGTVWLGRTGPAAEGITEINLAQTKDVAKLADVEDSALGLGVRINGSAVIRDNGSGGGAVLSFRRAINDFGDQPGETERGQIVKYVTPEFGGFAITAAWGGDDYWDVGLNYKGEFSGFKVAAGIAYGQETIKNAPADNDEYQIGNCRATDDDENTECQQVGGSISVMHEETGLYANFAAGWREDDLVAGEFDPAGAAGAVDEDSTFYAIEAGIERKFIALGKTTIFGQYYELDGGSNNNRDVVIPGGIAGVVAGTYNIAGSSLEVYGGGVVQELSGASMLLYVYYRHAEVDFDLVNGVGAPVVGTDFDDLDLVVAGGMIKF